MRLPRDIDGAQLDRALNVLGYEITRQKGSHIRVTTQRGGENHEVIPAHQPIKTGTLASILKRIAAHHRLTVEELLELLGF
ncbi:MAG: type II toxin-antitoxin system HicA family toxin [Terracidiphilus sp.]|jgi:predicted RNA binding protein YcfA (HicA-like mRNA interferase family)